jgi:hypothetical protein
MALIDVAWDVILALLIPQRESTSHRVEHGRAIPLTEVDRSTQMPNLVKATVQDDHLVWDSH